MTGLFSEMGVSHSKINQKVRKVAPLENKDVFVSPNITISGVNGLKNTSSFGIMGLKAPTSEHQLPPLRESLYGKGSVVPRPLSFDVSLHNGDTSSIIKKHPPRRLQKLEPEVLPSILAAEGIMRRQGAAAARKEQELEKKVFTAQNTSARRQHIHKMQMQEINRKREQMNHLQSQAEMKRNIHRETKINKHKMKEIKAKKVRENAMKCREDEDFLPVEHDETFNVDHSNTWHWLKQEPNSTADCQRGKGKLEMWFQPHYDGSESNSESSSTDSLDSWLRGDAKGRRRPATLFRTKAEKIPTFDEFFDREFNNS
ncbi:factor associated with metabolism and energy isoform 1-T1 [Anomaloglossus baeobatrachus]|uniref:factor associated with metabolism and energy isoform X1 n=1 Tax=Anomaloglossus baeobatrachus TaxID=238106 RepID=UPI003F502FED